MIPRPSGLLSGLPATSIALLSRKTNTSVSAADTFYPPHTVPLLNHSMWLGPRHLRLHIAHSSSSSPSSSSLPSSSHQRALYIASSPEIWCHSSSPNTHQILMICWSCFLKIFHTRQFFFCTVTSLIQATLISIPCPPILSPAVKLSCLQCQSDIFPRGPKLLILKD